MGDDIGYVNDPEAELRYPEEIRVTVEDCVELFKTKNATINETAHEHSNLLESYYKKIHSDGEKSVHSEAKLKLKNLNDLRHD